MVKKILLIIFVCVPFFGGVQAESTDLQPITELERSGSYQQIILSLPVEQYQRDKKYIALDPESKRVDIIAQEIVYEEEAESFAKHRRHYVAFWTLFLFMFGVDILWAE